MRSFELREALEVLGIPRLRRLAPGVGIAGVFHVSRELIAAHGYGPMLWEVGDSADTRGIPDGRGTTFDQSGDDGRGYDNGVNWKDALEGYHGPSFGFVELVDGQGAAHVDAVSAGVEFKNGMGVPRNDRV